MTSYGVRCTMADGEDTLITVDAEDAAGALMQVHEHNRIFGGSDAAGTWLASKRSPERTIVEIHEAKPASEWA